MTRSRQPLHGAGEFRRGWPIVLTSGVGIALGLSPIPFYEIGLFAPQLAAEFGWGIGTIMAGIFFMMCGSLIAAPVVGLLADRYGERRVILISLVCFSACLGLFSMQRGSLTLYYANWFAMAFTGAGTLPITWTRSVNQYFDLKKGLALGVALAGTGVSSFVLKPATGAIIAGFGWRSAFLFLAALPIAIALPLTWVGLGTPNASRADRRVAVDDTQGLSLSEAVRDPRFWLIGLGLLPVAFAISGPIANMESILKSRGADHGIFVHLVPFVGLAVIAGRLGGGWLIDRIWAPAVGFGLFTLSAIASWLLVTGPPTPVVVFLGVIGVGLGAGAEFDLMSFLTARYFGSRRYGVIYGILYAFFAIGSGVAPLIYGRAFDASRSFSGIVTWGAAAMFGGGAIMLLLGRYRYRPESVRAVAGTPEAGGSGIVS